MIESAPAKVNLALHLRRRRSDGYHDLETLFAFTDFGDTLRVMPQVGLGLIVDGPFAAAVGHGGAGDDNLVLRAARALAAAANCPADAALTLDKHIPVAAGLGGGSADAAAALRLLNRFWGLDWSFDRLAEVAAPLGADVPACVFSRTLGWGGAGRRAGTDRPRSRRNAGPAGQPPRRGADRTGIRQLGPDRPRPARRARMARGAQRSRAAGDRAGTGDRGGARRPWQDSRQFRPHVGVGCDVPGALSNGGSLHRRGGDDRPFVTRLVAYRDNPPVDFCCTAA